MVGIHVVFYLTPPSAPLLCWRFVFVCQVLKTKVDSLYAAGHLFVVDHELLAVRKVKRFRNAGQITM